MTDRTVLEQMIAEGYTEDKAAELMANTLLIRRGSGPHTPIATKERTLSAQIAHLRTLEEMGK